MTHSIFETDVAADPGDGSPPHRRAAFGYDVDGTSYDYDLPTITGAQLMFAAGIGPQLGLVQLLTDAVARHRHRGPDDASASLPEPRFRRRPRFKRG